MKAIDEHPTLRRFSAMPPPPPEATESALEGGRLRQEALDCGADDVGFVDIEHPDIASERSSVLAVFPGARTLISYVVRMNRGNIRTPARSLSNLEFKHTAEDVDEAGRRIAAGLERRGIRALSLAAGFPMEMDGWPGRIWTVSHKPVAVAAGLGKMGIHRSVIHPRFGSFVLLGTVVTEARVDGGSAPLDFNPCVECKLCVAACPTGAIGADGAFDFSACYTHNYREFMGGFSDWVEGVAESRNRADYRRRVSDTETLSMWQSLGFGPNYKAAYCISVCPAGEEVISPFLLNRAGFLRDVVRPLQDKPETVYVTSGSDAEAYVPRRFPHKRVKRVGNGIRPSSVRGFLEGMKWTFQPGRAAGLDATYHFTFTGAEKRAATVRIRDARVEVEEGHLGKADSG